MVTKKHNSIQIALISILLLIGQFGVLIHAVDHPLHAQEQSCEAFLQCEKSGNAFISPDLLLPFLASHPLSTRQAVNVWLSLSQTAYHSRAPPSLS